MMSSRKVRIVKRNNEHGSRRDNAIKAVWDAINSIQNASIIPKRCPRHTIPERTECRGNCPGPDKYEKDWNPKGCSLCYGGCLVREKRIQVIRCANTEERYVRENHKCGMTFGTKTPYSIMLLRRREFWLHEGVIRWIYNISFCDRCWDLMSRFATYGGVVSHREELLLPLRQYGLVGVTGRIISAYAYECKVVCPDCE